MLHELLGFILEERQLLIRRVLELDDLPLSQADEAVVESRLAYLRKTPSAAVSLDEMKARVRSCLG